MNTPTLPEHIGGFQHLEPDVPVGYDDIYVDEGKPVRFTSEAMAGFDVGTVEKLTGYRIYRKYAVAKQGDLDHPPVVTDGTEHDKLPGVVAARALGCSLPTDAKARKQIPLASGLLDYFPLALCAVAELSRIGNDQHNPGKPLHWDRSKSGDEADALMRHLLQRNETDRDGVEHAVKCAWRALALAQKRLEGLKK